MPLLHNPLPIRVYWEDTDAGGVVFYANYLKFWERARTEWLRSRGVEQGLLRDTLQRMFVVSAVQLSYCAPARLDDLLSVTVQVTEAGKASLALRQEVWRQDTLLAHGSVRIACVDAVTLRAARIPQQVLDQLGV